MTDAPVVSGSRVLPPYASGKVVSIARGGLRSGVREARRECSTGESLKTLGNAAKYLAQSRMFLVARESGRAEKDAVGVLRQLSRKVFQEAPAAVAALARVGGW